MPVSQCKRLFVAVALAGLAAGLMASSPAPSLAGDFIPQGYTYGPGHENLPRLNSAQDRFQNQTDLRETQNYWSQRQQVMDDARLRQVIGHGDEADFAFSPRY